MYPATISKCNKKLIFFNYAFLAVNFYIFLNCILPRKKRLREMWLRQKKWNARRLLIKQNKTNQEALKCLCGMAKQSKKNNKDTVGMPCIRCKNRNMKVSLEDKMELGRNTKKSCWIKKMTQVESWMMRKMKEIVKKCHWAVVKALNLMKAAKAAKPSGVTSELLKLRNNEEIADELFQGKKMLENWWRSVWDTNPQRKRTC